jgi:biopolymer transport protein ExbD
VATSTTGGGPLHSEINITPLVDVVLVLLIIFMVIVPLTLRGYDVDMPAESLAATPAEPPAEQIVLGIDAADCPAVEPPADAGLPAACRVHVGDEPMPAAELGARLPGLFAGRAAEDRVLFLAADERLNYEAVLRIVDVAKASVDGLRVGIVTE